MFAFALRGSPCAAQQAQAKRRRWRL